MDQQRDDIEQGGRGQECDCGGKCDCGDRCDCAQGADQVRAGQKAACAHGHAAHSRCHHHKRFAEVPETRGVDLTWRGAEGGIAYRASAGHIQVREDDGSPIGSMFCLSYVARGDDADASRPVTFAFNGGPGSASVPINVGGIGPRIAVPNGDRRIGPAPFQTVDNPDTILPFSDIVFIDALGTGWSEFAHGVKPQRAWGVDKDAECFARFVEAWLEQTGRHNSPLYLFGESYGTTRNAVCARILEERGVPLSGVVMLSALLDWTATLPGCDFAYVQMLPTYASIARYHGKSSFMREATDDELFSAVARFAEDSLAPALLKGDRLDAAQEADLARDMAQMTGLPQDFIARRHLRVELTDFRSELLADQGMVVGRLDGRFSFEAGNFLQTSREGQPEDDPADSAMSGAWGAAWHHLVSQEIGYRNPRPYVLGNYEKIGPAWDHKHRSAGAMWDSTTANVAYDLATTMRHNPLMRVLFLGGRYDLATPWLGPIQDMARMYLGPSTKPNLTWRLYDAGHMIYVNPDARAKMTADVKEFYQG